MLINRIARLFRADLHAVLDRIEEPAPLLRQSLREMEGALSEAGARLATDLRRRAAIGRRQDEIAARLSTVSAELDLCFDAGNDSLARLLLRRRLEAERLLQRLQQQAAALDAGIAEQQRELEQRREQFEQLRQQAALHADDAGDDSETVDTSTSDVTDADVELALLRERRMRA